jgi:hypothetical protein
MSLICRGLWEYLAHQVMNIILQNETKLVCISDSQEIVLSPCSIKCIRKDFTLYLRAWCCRELGKGCTLCWVHAGLTRVHTVLSARWSNKGAPCAECTLVWQGCTLCWVHPGLTRVLTVLSARWSDKGVPCAECMLVWQGCFPPASCWLHFLTRSSDASGIACCELSSWSGDVSWILTAETCHLAGQNLCMGSGGKRRED